MNIKHKNLFLTNHSSLHGSRSSLIKILFLSNCYGEDRSAALIAKELKLICNLQSSNLTIKIKGAPLISEGKEYKKLGIPILIEGKMPPSGGFTTKKFLSFIKDIPYFYIPIRYFFAIRKCKPDIVVVIGDVFLAILGYMATKIKPIFISQAKSLYQTKYYKIELFLMHKFIRKVFTHDEYTAKKLIRENIDAEFVGNPMIDNLIPEGNFVFNNEKKLIGILPGSRKEGYNNLLKILNIIEQLDKNLCFAVALPHSLKLEKIIKLTKKHGWQFQLGKITKNNIEVYIFYNAFVDIITQSDIVIGLSGTANEQTASLGKPIIAFKGTGPQTSKKRMQEQEKLLGGCLKYIDNYPNGVIDEINYLLENEDERKQRGELGKKRMGPTGGVKNIANFVMNLIFLPTI